MSRDALEVRRLTVGPIESNCYLVRRAPGSEAVVIDPGAEADRVEAVLRKWDAEPAAILLTHAHMDHVGAIAELGRRYGPPVYLHPADRSIYDAAAERGAAFGIPLEKPPPPDHALEDGQSLEVAGIRFEVRHAPGHSPGGVVFRTNGHAFVGDCLFAGSVGRTDLPGGDGETLLRSIRERILSLPPDTTLWPGHGPKTTVRREKESNPFLTGAVRWTG